MEFDVPKIKAALASFVALLSLTALAAPVTGADGVVVDVENPDRVVALNSSVLEVMYELGLEERVVGTDNSGLYPENDLPKVGHPYNYGVEGVISLSPDLVISAQENMKPETAAQLRDAGIPVLVLSHSGEGGMEALYTRIGQIATVFEVEDRGEELVNRIRSDLDALQSELTQIPEDERLEVMFIYSHSLGDSTIYGGEDTGPGVLIELAGADDAADFIDGAHVTISSEALVTANPDVIIMMQRGLDAIGGVSGYLQLPGVSLTTAGHNEAIYTVDDSVRWIGPRFPQFAAQLARDLYGIEVP